MPNGTYTAILNIALLTSRSCWYATFLRVGQKLRDALARGSALTSVSITNEEQEPVPPRKKFECPPKLFRPFLALVAAAVEVAKVLSIRHL